MRNRAKCKLCNDIIESFHSTDLVYCKCGEIFVDGGESLMCGASDWNNFLRVDDEGHEIIITVKEKKDIAENNQGKPSKKDLVKMLDDMIDNIEKLPSHAMTTAINHYDFCSLLILLSSILKAED